MLALPKGSNKDDSRAGLGTATSTAYRCFSPVVELALLPERGRPRPCVNLFLSAQRPAAAAAAWDRKTSR